MVRHQLPLPGAGAGARPGRFELRAAHWAAPLREAAELGIATRPVVLGPLTFLLLCEGPGAAARAARPAGRGLPGAARRAWPRPAPPRSRSTSRAWPSTAAPPSSTPSAAPGGAELRRPAVPSSAWRPTSPASTRRPLLERLAGLPGPELHLDLVRAPEQLAPALRALAGRRPGSRSASSTAATSGSPTPTWRSTGSTPPAPRSAPSGSRSPPPARCCTSPTRRRASRGSTPRSGPGSPSAPRSSPSSTCCGGRPSAARERDGLLGRGPGAGLGSRRTSTHTNDPAVRDRVGGAGAGRLRPRGAVPARRALQAQRARQPLPELPTTTIGSYPQTAEIRAARRDLREGRLEPGGLRRVHRRRDRRGGRLPGGDRPRRARPRRARAQRHGRVLRPAARRLRLLRRRLGAVLRQPLREAADPVRRRLAAGGDDGRVVALRAVDDREADEGDADRPGDDPAVVLRPRRPAAARRPAPRSPWRSRTRCSTSRRPGRSRSRSTRRRCARGCRCSRRARRLRALGGRLLPARPSPRPRPETQIHTHMCYSEFNEMIEHIIRLDADVLSIEASRSGMEVLDAFAGGLAYPNEIGPGVYDIHSPRVPVGRRDRAVCWSWPRAGSAASGSGSTPTAA